MTLVAAWGKAGAWVANCESNIPNSAAITSAFDNLARLTGTWLKNSGGTILNSHQYGYNLAGQRTALTNTLGNYLNYTYDLIGQLKRATGKEAVGTSRLNEQFGYAYDAAGNLNRRTNNALVVTFKVKCRNQQRGACHLFLK